MSSVLPPQFDPAPPSRPERAAPPVRATATAAPADTPDTPPAAAEPGPSAGIEQPVPDAAPAWAAFVMRWRWALVPLWVLMQLLAFNGQWRIGPDSAVYRSVGHSLAIGQGYTIVGEPQRHIYPGLPLLLAGLERVFGEVVWPAELTMVLLSAGVVGATYLLMRRLSSPWFATVVTAGVAFNGDFLQFSHELLTDVPFLLGVVLTLLGWEMLGDRGPWRKARGAAVLLAGLGIAALMRPTFWVLAVALVLTCVGGLLVSLWRRLRTGRPASERPATALVEPISFLNPSRPRSWVFYAGCLLVVAVVTVAFLALDPRTRQLDVIGGRYEAEVIDRVVTLGRWFTDLPWAVWTILYDHLPAAFFAERVFFLNVQLALALLAGVWMLGRHRPLWGLTVMMLLGAVLFASSAPRYYLMVLPILWAGWILVVLWTGRRWFKTRDARAIWSGVLIGLIWAANVGHGVKLIVEQRSTPFLEEYGDGQYLAMEAIGRVIRENTEPHERIIGPIAPVLTYESGRRVLGARELLRYAGPQDASRVAAIESSGATWMVFPHETYLVQDAPISNLVSRGIVVPANRTDEEAFIAGEFDGLRWYLAPYAIDPTQMEGWGKE